MRFNHYEQNGYVTFLVLGLPIRDVISPLLTRSAFFLPIGFYAGIHAVYLKENSNRKEKETKEEGREKENSRRVKWKSKL